MSMTIEEQRAYGRGYHAGRSLHWPAHRLPEPPNEVLRSYMQAVNELADFCQRLADQQKDFASKRAMLDRIELLQHEERRVGEWLMQKETS